MQNNIFSGLFIGQNLVTLKEVDSTNNYLKQILSNSKPLPEGTVIMAENQIAGRGQMQNGWFSEARKNLTFSILLLPEFLGVKNQFDLNRVMSLGIYNALYPLLGAPLKIKWPNDIYYGNKKIGGVLIENQVQGAKIREAVIGIGLNVNQNVFPASLPNAASIGQILKKNLGLTELLNSICNNIEHWYLTLKAGNRQKIRSAYLTTLYRFNECSQFRTPAITFNGSIIDVDEGGELIIKDDENRLHSFKFKEVQFL